MGDVKELARWLHEAYLLHAPPGARPWRRLSATERRQYVRVARKLLEEPPDCLIRALGTAPAEGG
jgi:acyl-CoA reductase-like NAD-dependent aldehyde dehydrogenase